MTITSNGRITRNDIETKLREMAGELEDQAEAARKPSTLAGLAAGGLLVLLVVYLLGRRSGRAKSAVVEIRRL